MSQIQKSYEPSSAVCTALVATTLLLAACGKNEYKTTAVSGQTRASSQVEKQVSQIRFNCPSGNCEPFASTALLMIKAEQTVPYSTCTGVLAHNNTLVYTSSRCLPKAVLDNPDRCSEFVAMAFPGISGGQGVVRGCNRLISVTQGTNPSQSEESRAENSGLLPKHTVFIAALKIDPIERRVNSIPWGIDKASEDGTKVTINFPVLNANSTLATFRSVKCAVRNRSALAPTFDLPRAALQPAIAAGPDRPCDVEGAGLHGAPVYTENGNQIAQHWVALTQGSTDLTQLKQSIHPKYKFLRRGAEIQSDQEIPRHVRFANVSCYSSYDPEPNLSNYYCDRPHKNLSGPLQQFPMREMYSDRLQPHELANFVSTHIPQADRDQRLKAAEQAFNKESVEFFQASARFVDLNIIARPNCVAPSFLGQLTLRARTAVSPPRATVLNLSEFSAI